jgi:hypothetical protein
MSDDVQDPSLLETYESASNSMVRPE